MIIRFFLIALSFMGSQEKMQGLISSTSKDTLVGARLLIVDDDAFLRATLREQLSIEGVKQIDEAATLTEVFDCVNEGEPDLIILDIRLPDGNGVAICQKLRDRGFANPIIMLTGQDSEDDIVAGLEAGANDYVIKPMRLGELLARIRSQLRQHKSSDTARFSFGGLSFVPANKLLFDDRSNRKAVLTEKEATILKFLYRAHPNGVSKEQLLTEVWGFQDGLSTHTVETHIYRLRQKISRLTSAPVVLTTRLGYSLSSVP